MLILVRNDEHAVAFVEFEFQFTATDFFNFFFALFHHNCSRGVFQSERHLVFTFFGRIGEIDHKIPFPAVLILENSGKGLPSPCRLYKSHILLKEGILNEHQYLH